MTDGAIVAAAQLSNRYITDRFLPDKAIDLIDEAASKLRIEMDSLPEELDEVERKIKQLEIEKEAVRREKDEESQKRLLIIECELADLREESGKLNAHWKVEKDLIQSIQKSKEEIEKLKIDADKAERLGDLGKVAEIRYGKIIELEKKMKESTKKLGEAQKSSKMLKEEVDSEEISRRSFPSGREFLFLECSKASGASFFTSKTKSMNVSSIKKRQYRRLQTQFVEQATPGSKTRSAHSFSSALRVSVKRNWRVHLLKPYLTMKTPWCESTCRNTLRNFQSPD